MFPMQNFEPESAVISVSSNSALIEKYLRNTCLGQGVELNEEGEERKTEGKGQGKEKEKEKRKKKGKKKREEER